ncbi:MAG TPA: hypothetical protein VNM69_17940 [Bacillus sp. (in: firmicutes)]|nr:hypothetical protein [Bacillus sp. (in: firmicutes)]
MISNVKSAHIASKYKLQETKQWHAINEAFEDGIKEVLRELALIKCHQYEKKNVESEKIKDVKEDVLQHEDDIRMAFTGRELDLIINYEDDLNHLRALECEEYFIQGFIEGYRFLKCINERTFIDKGVSDND